MVFWDLIHQSVNEVLLALQMSGLWPVVLELLLVFRLPYGPYAGQKFWRDLQSAAKILQTVDLDTSSHFAVWRGTALKRRQVAAPLSPTCGTAKGSGKSSSVLHF